jgi:TolB-like protein/DNA-binding winged helix-turn-helix (wHTH) protein
MQTYRFGEFELDLDAQELRSGGQLLHLERRPMDLLALLVRSQGRLVSRDELVHTLWPKNVIIDFDSGLNTLVRKVRQALGDSSGEPRFIVTVPGRGYRFIAPVDEPAESVVAPSAALPENLRSSRVRHIAAPILLALLLVAGAVSLVRWQAGETQPPGTTRIAVLPFENLTGDDELGYLASGLAEETGISLSRLELPDFRVIGGMSARTIAIANLPLRTIGKELDADYLVVSALSRAGSKIRVTSRLIQVADGEQVWSAPFDRELTNVLGLQRELSIAIAEQVRQQLSPDVAAAIDRRQTRNPAAYELYLKGLHSWHKFTPDMVPRALEYYEAAVALDPRYALAWAEVTRVLASSPVTMNADIDTVRERAHDALQKALEYGPDLAEVQLAAESYYMFIEWDFASAEAAGRRAIAMAPDNGLAHMVLGMVLDARSKHVEANQMLRRARELEPFFPLMFANSAIVAVRAGDPQTGVEHARQAIAISREFWPGYFHLGNGLVALGDLDGALAAFETCERYSGGNLMATVSRAAVLAMQGREHEVREILARLAALAETEYVSPVWFGIIYAALEERDQAFAWLELAWETRDVRMTFADDDWLFMSLQGDPRLQSLMERCQCGRQQLKAPGVNDNGALLRGADPVAHP